MSAEPHADDLPTDTCGKLFGEFGQNHPIKMEILSYPRQSILFFSCDNGHYCKLIIRISFNERNIAFTCFVPGM